MPPLAAVVPMWTASGKACTSVGVRSTRKCSEPSLVVGTLESMRPVQSDLCGARALWRVEWRLPCEVPRRSSSCWQVSYRLTRPDDGRRLHLIRSFLSDREDSFSGRRLQRQLPAVRQPIASGASGRCERPTRPYSSARTPTCLLSSKGLDVASAHLRSCRARRDLLGYQCDAAHGDVHRTDLWTFTVGSCASLCCMCLQLTGAVDTR